MKKKIIFTLAAVAASASLVAGCGKSASQETTESQKETTEEALVEVEETSEGDAQIANPWTSSDKDGVLEATGFEMTAPEGAKDVLYSYMEDGKLAQMDYELDDMIFVYRMQMADEFTDISGMEYEWDSEEDGNVSGRDAKYYVHVGSDTEDGVQTVNWYDAVPGVMYSLSAMGSDLDGMDIQAYAESIFVPLQGEVDGDSAAETGNN